jgi:hypothetical protein
MANSTRVLALTRLRYDSALCGHAMPFGGVTLTTGFGGVCGKFSGPVFAINGRGVPISRGSPPFYDV